MGKLVCIGGGEIPRIKNGIQLPYETREIDEEIVRLSEKKNPKLLFIGTASSHSQEYYLVIKKIFEELGCIVSNLDLLEENIDMELFQCKNIYEINKKYNAVICSEVLEHLNDSELEGFCTQLCDIVQSGGLLLITVPNGRGSYEKSVISWSKFQKVINSKFVKKIQLMIKKI